MASGSDRDLIAAALPGYDIGEQLGHGAWGVVVAGRQRQLGRDVAIKQLPSQFGDDPAVRARFITEARLLASLDHPHIVPIYDFVEHEGLCLLIMEYLPGGTVWTRARGAGLSAPAACAVVVAACAGLHYAHQRGVLHRDVKPENMVFSSEDVLKVTDFGIAKVVGGTATMATRAGYVLGTPAYIAPEQAMGEPLSPATDVYAAATVLYELLSGTLPYPEATDPIVAVFQHVHKPPTPLREAAPALPASLEEICARALARDPDERYQSAQDLGVAIVGAAVAEWGSGWAGATGIALRDTAIAGVAPVDRSAATIAAPSSTPTVVASSTRPPVVAAVDPAELVPIGEVLPRPRKRWRLIAAVLAPVVAVAVIGGYLLVGRHPGLGDGPAGIAQPQDIAVDRAGTLYILDGVRSRVVRRTPDGVFSLYAGNTAGTGGDGGPAVRAPLDSPSSLALGPDGSLYIAGNDDGKVRRVTPDGVIHTVPGSENVGDSVAAIAVAGDGTIYLAGNHVHKVFRISRDGTVSVVAGTGTAGSTGDGGPATAAEIDSPQGIAVDAQGEVFLADPNQARVRRFRPGALITTFAGTGQSSASGDDGPAARAGLNYPYGVGVDAAGEVLIADVGDQRIRKVKTDGTIEPFAGTGRTGFAGDGRGATDATFHNPGRVAFDGAGNTYVADYFNHRVRRIAPNGIVTTIA